MDGVINIYKPIGITSFDVVRRLKKIYNTGKIGHTGTLDPLACGVLPICVGKATKIVDYIMSETKVYKTKLRLGIETDTYDQEGNVLSESEVKLSETDVIAAIHDFIGDIEQIPPMYSALKVNGKRLYDLARKGIEVEREKRKISIYSIEITNIALPEVEFIVACSKGTYIRSLCYDIGNKLNVGGTMWALERIQTGQFSVKDSVTLEELEDSSNPSRYLISIESVLGCFKVLSFNDKYEKLLLNGVKLNNGKLIESIEKNTIYRVYINEISFIGLGMRDDQGFKIIKLLNWEH